MKKTRTLAVASLLAVALLAACGPKGPTPSADLEESQRTQLTSAQDLEDTSSVLLEIDPQIGDYGSGVVVAPDMVLTAKHVVYNNDTDPVPQLTIRHGGLDAQGQERFENFPVQEIIPGPDGIDIALVKVGQNDQGHRLGDVATSSPIAPATPPQVGDAITIQGYPGDKTYGSLWRSQGTITDIDQNLLIMDALVSPGNCGSPIFNPQGQVIGTLSAGEGNQSIGFYYDDTIRTFLSDHLPA